MAYAWRHILSLALVTALYLTAEGCNSICGNVRGNVVFHFIYNIGSLTVVTIQNPQSSTSVSALYNGTGSVTDTSISPRIRFIGDFTTGNLSFQLDNVQMSDSGEYKMVIVSNLVIECTTLYITGRPDPPTHLSVRNVLETSISLTWRVSSPDGVSDPLSYIDYKSVTENWERGPTAVLVNGTTRSVTIWGLTPNTAYMLRVFTANANVSSEFSEYVLAVTNSGRPDPPTHLSVRNVSKTSISLTWRDSSLDGVSDPLSHIDYKSVTENWERGPSNNAVSQSSPCEIGKVVGITIGIIAGILICVTTGICTYRRRSTLSNGPGSNSTTSSNTTYLSPTAESTLRPAESTLRPAESTLRSDGHQQENGLYDEIEERTPGYLTPIQHHPVEGPHDLHVPVHDNPRSGIVDDTPSCETPLSEKDVLYVTI